MAAVILTFVSSIYAAFTIKLNANLDELVSEKLDYHRRYIEFLKEFGDEEYLYVIVDASADLPGSKKFMDALGEKLKGSENLKQVVWKIENPELEKNFLLYLSPNQLKSLKAMTTSGPFAVKNIAAWDGFAPLVGALAVRISEPVSGADETELATGFTFVDGLFDDMSASLESSSPYHSRLQELFFGGGETFDPDGYLKNGSLLFMLIMPKKDFSTMEVISKPLGDIRETIKEVKKTFPGIDAGLTGRPVLSADEMQTSNRDTTYATIAAIIVEMFLLFLFFRNAARPAFAVMSLVMGISWTFGLVAVLYGTLNILSIVFAIILASTAIEYAIQITARYQEELSAAGSVSDAVEKSLTLTGKAVLTSALTTAAAFCTILWTDFTALVQLGVIAASGIILCLVAMITVLPALLVMRDRKLSSAELMKVHPFVMPRIERIYKRPWIVFAGSMLVTAVLAVFAVRTSFDNNLLNLQARGLESVKYERMIIDKSSETTWFARDVADTIEESHAKARAFEKLPSVRKVDDVEKILPENQDEKIGIVKEMAPAFDKLSFGEVGDSLNEGMLMYELGRLAHGLDRLTEQAFAAGRADAVEELGLFSGKARKLAELLNSANDAQLKSLGALRRDFFTDLQKNLTILAGGMNPSHIELGSLPSDITGRFVSPKGRFALFIYPKENIWDPPALEKFVSDIRSVDPDVVGTPIEVYESGKLMRGTLARSGVLAFIVICVLVWLDFRSLRCVLLAVLPLVVGTVWLLGTMGIFGLKFNMANFFSIPILIGIGVDFGVNVTHRLRQERSFAAIGTSMGKGVLLTALANAAGFGTMTFAHHRGIASLGAVMAIGCIFCFLAAVIPMPPVAKWMNWGFGSRFSNKV